MPKVEIVDEEEVEPEEPVEIPRVLFIGGKPQGKDVLDLILARGIDLVGIFCLEEDDHELVRASDEIVELAGKENVPVKVCKKLDSKDVKKITTEYKPDLILMVGWRTLIPKEVLDFPRLGCVGVHESPLPQYRGFAPVNWAIINGLTHWGVSLFHLTEGVNDGDIVGRTMFDVQPRATAPELNDKVTAATVLVVDKNLDGLLAGTAPRTPQNHDAATFGAARRPADGEIIWDRQTTEQIDRLVRGLTFPYPGAWTMWKGDVLIVWEAEPVLHAPAYEGRIPGRIVSFTDKTADVLTTDGVLRLHSVQLASGERVPAGQILRTVKHSLGE